MVRLSEPVCDDECQDSERPVIGRSCLSVPFVVQRWCGVASQ